MELKTKFLGKEIHNYNKIDSTQAEIWRRIEDGNISNGTIIRADIQTNGVGTHGRIWHTDEQNNIAFSFFINANCKVSLVDGITIEVAETILEVFKNLYNIELGIKVPNDIVYNKKKIGGILCQTKLNGELVKYIVIGIGLNTNKKHFSEDIKNIASSIKKEFRIDINNEDVINEFCNLFEKKIIKRIGDK